MANCEKLLVKAKNSTTNFKFSELVKLAECYGWKYRRTSGSHHIYSNPRIDMPFHTLTLVDRKGGVLAYHVRNLLTAIELLETEK